MSRFPVGLIEQVKAAAEADLPGLVEAAGFRPSRLRRKYHCGAHPDKTPSAHLYEDRVHCFSCGKSWDAIDLERSGGGTTGGGTTGEAITRLAQRYGLKTEESAQMSGPRISNEVLAEAHLFHVGLRWHMDRELAIAKESFWQGLSFDAQRIRELTQLSTQIGDWSSFRAAEDFLEMRRVQPRFVAERVEEAAEAHWMFAAVFGCAMPAAGEIAA